MSCVACRLGRIWECRNNGPEGGCGSSGIDPNSFASIVGGDSPSEDSGSEPVREIKTYKTDAALKDQQSTGRKRAAAMYPLDKEAACEWQMQKNCGGGSNPIVGCADGKQQARHHGPDKNTLNNDAGNVHRICHNCHNRWHARNDDGYVWGGVYKLHSPSSCSQEEVITSELSWLGKTLKNIAD